MDLFTDKVSYMHILHNDKPFKSEPLSLFDTENFTELKIVTYVSSPDFFFDKVKKFKKVIAILGEEESAREFYQLDLFLRKGLSILQSQTLKSLKPLQMVELS